MKKSKKNSQSYPEPYEDIIRVEKLDPYESLIRVNLHLKENNKSIE
jgi:hypothetical protein